jgi:enoyl-CoA hydratase/carnithine racemase
MGARWPAIPDIDEPMVVVDLDADPIDVPALTTSVVIGVSRAAEPISLAAERADVALSVATDQLPVPWVACTDLDQELERLESRIRAWPIAAVTLAQVLRAGTGQAIPAGLLIESLAYSMLQSGPEFQAWLRERPAPHAKAVEEDPVLVAREGPVLTVTLNRPEVHNAYNALMRDRLSDALSIAVADPTVKEVRWVGAGPSFCSGGDLTEFGTFPDPATAHLIRTTRSPAYALSLLADRVKPHVHGFCVGSGIELPAFARTLTADPSATFQLPEMAMGLIPGAGGTVSIARRIGPSRTAWLVLSGHSLDSATALAWGLVDRVAPRAVPSELPGLRKQL